MNNNHWLKTSFGFLIFIFSLALAYATADYVGPTNTANYWAVLAIFAGTYIFIGMIVHYVFAVSLSFLLAADILLLHLLGDKYDLIPDLFKTTIIGALLIILYVIAWHSFKDESESLLANNSEEPRYE